MRTRWMATAMISCLLLACKGPGERGTSGPTGAGDGSGASGQIGTTGQIGVGDQGGTGDPGGTSQDILPEEVTCAAYCSDDDRSENCAKCGADSPKCIRVNSKGCISGKWPEVRKVTSGEPWRHSRSTHFGLTYAGACGLGLYGLCTPQFSFSDLTLKEKCSKFCKAYPALCQDPSGGTLRGNFAAPQGNYYTQHWPSLSSEQNNYLSCGECFEVKRTQKDGSDYQPGDPGYTPPIVLQIVDSCPCSANSKWCCGSGRDHCGEVSDFRYGCPLPPGPPAPSADHDPLPDESIHLDLSDIAMARLQTGDPNGPMIDGVIPTKYRRTPCPVAGNIFLWLRSGAGPYWFSLSVVNVGGLGSVVQVEAYRKKTAEWVPLVRDPNYAKTRPQERYGAWVTPQGSGPFELPIPIRITDPANRKVVTENAITSWSPEDATLKEMFYIDTGVQFP